VTIIETVYGFPATAGASFGVTVLSLGRRPPTGGEPGGAGGGGPAGGEADSGYVHTAVPVGARSPSEFPPSPVVVTTNAKLAVPPKSAAPTSKVAFPSWYEARKLAALTSVKLEPAQRMRS